MATPHLERSRGTILNIGSLSPSSPSWGSTIYGASKASIEYITLSLAKELGPKGIRINTVVPGMTQTDQLDEHKFVTPELKAMVIGMTPLGRLGLPEDIAPACLLVCSNDA
jgi:3-oxoacyl-[acyl-carrier protein] reductase